MKLLQRVAIASLLLRGRLRRRRHSARRRAPARATRGRTQGGRGGRGGARSRCRPDPIRIRSTAWVPIPCRRKAFRKGEIRGPFTSAEQRLSRHSAHLLGLCAAQYDPKVPAALMVYPGRAGVQRRERRSARAERDGQPDLPPRDSGHDRRLHQSRPHAGTGGTQPADRLGRWHHQPRHRIQHARTTSMRA